MRYKVCKYSREKLVTMFNNTGLATLDECHQRIGWWLEMKRNEVDTQFVIIDTETDKIIELK